MEPRRNSNLILDYMQYCREHQNVIHNALNDLRNINRRMSDFISLEINSRNTSELIELSRAVERINNFVPQEVPPPSHVPPPSDPPSNILNFRLSSLNRPQEPPPPPPTPPIPSTLPIPPPPPPPPLPGVIPYPSETEMNENTNRRENRNNLIRNTSTASESERHILPLSTRILRNPIATQPSTSTNRDSSQSPLNYDSNRLNRINRRNRTNRRMNNRFDRIFTFSNPTRMPLLNNFSNLSPVRIRPSNTQIRRGTEILVWSDISDNYQTHCPIDMQDFTGNDSILRIRHCGHIFREMNLRRHFRNNTRCPICRFDIRDYIQPENDYISENTNSIESEARRRNYLPTSLMNTIDEDILDVIEEAVNNVALDSSSNVITADITYQIR